MRKHFLLLIALYTLSVSAVERVSLEQLQADWSRYTNQMVQLTTPLVVCGSFYDSLILAPERLYCPEEKAIGLADGDSTDYRRIVASNRANSICVHCRNDYYKVRTGDRVRGFKARVTSERHLLTGSGVKTSHSRVAPLKKAEKGAIRVVGANVENLFADLGGYATRRTKPEQNALKVRKVAKGLKAMKADLYALCEVQVGDKAPKMLLEALNKGCAKYAYVSMPMDNIDRIGGCFIYRVDRVQPYEAPLSAYADTSSHYHARMFAQGFVRIDKKGQSTGERFVVSLNHLKSKRPGRGNYDTHLKRMSNVDSLLAMLPKATALYGDSDILLLGDYNCYTQELPIQSIVRAGYPDQLMRFCPDDYSYVFKGEMGYLDRCFASPSMAVQVVHVQPWHVNADWYYQHSAFRLKDKSLHRYADHEPIIVDIKLK